MRSKEEIDRVYLSGTLVLSREEVLFLRTIWTEEDLHLLRVEQSFNDGPDNPFYALLPENDSEVERIAGLTFQHFMAKKEEV
jgi:hypothetical protein